jgi:hypothetical protein
MNTKWHNLRQRCNYLLVWIKRAARSRGFGVQSPTDYWIVRYVINEHWPYYQYDTIGCGDPWLRRKLGKLYFRLANWRQPAVVTTDDYQDYFLAGCRKAAIGKQGQLVRLTLDDGWQTRLNEFLDRANQQSVLVVEGIADNKEAWQQIVDDQRTGVTFDLYYCGLAMFDKKRVKKNYIINF